MDGLKKRLCNPPAEGVAATGDTEVLGLFEGAGDGLAYALTAIEEGAGGENGKRQAGYAAACATFEKAVVACEHDYLVARQRLAAETTVRMKAAIDLFVAAMYREESDEPPTL